jgi:hypothetical protein
MLKINVEDRYILILFPYDKIESLYLQDLIKKSRMSYAIQKYNFIWKQLVNNTNAYRSIIYAYKESAFNKFIDDVCLNGYNDLYHNERYNFITQIIAEIEQYLTSLELSSLLQNVDIEYLKYKNNVISSHEYFFPE